MSTDKYNHNWCRLTEEAWYCTRCDKIKFLGRVKGEMLYYWPDSAHDEGILSKIELPCKLEILL